MASDTPSHVVIYITPREIFDPSMLIEGDLYVSVEDRKGNHSALSIGVWAWRHRQWMIRLTVPVSVDIQPVQLKVN